MLTSKETKNEKKTREKIREQNTNFNTHASSPLSTYRPLPQRCLVSPHPAQLHRKAPPSIRKKTKHNTRARAHILSSTHLIQKLECELSKAVHGVHSDRRAVRHAPHGPKVVRVHPPHASPLDTAAGVHVQVRHLSIECTSYIHARIIYTYMWISSPLRHPHVQNNNETTTKVSDVPCSYGVTILYCKASESSIIFWLMTTRVFIF